MSTAMQVHEATKKAQSAFLWLGSSTIIWQVISWVFTIVIARILLPSYYGVFALLGTVTAYFALAAVLGLDSWIVQEEDFDEHKQEQAFLLLVLLGLLVAVLLLLTAPLFAAFFAEEQLTMVYRVVGVSFLFRSIAAFSLSMLKKELRFRPIAVINISVALARNILQLVLALLGYGYWSLVIGFVFMDVATCLWALYLKPPRICFSWDWKIQRKALKFGLTTTGATVLWTLGSTADYIAVGKFLGKEVLGYYSMAYFLAELPLSKVNEILSPVLLSYYSTLKALKTDLKQVYLRVVQMLVGTVGPVLAALAIVAPQLIRLLLGEKWAATVPMFQLLAVMSLVRTFGGNASQLFYALGRPDKNLTYQAVNCIILVPAFFVLTAMMGLGGVFVCWLGLYPLVMLFLLSLVRETTGIRYADYLSRIKVPLSAIAFMCAITLGGNLFASAFLSGIGLLLLGAATSVVSYAGALWFFFREDTLEVYRAFVESRRIPSSSSCSVEQ